jgi:hypothetical protein
MARGLVSGVIWGTVVSGLGIAALSLISSQVQPPAPAPDASTEIGVPGTVDGEDGPAAPVPVTTPVPAASPQPAQPLPPEGMMPPGAADPLRPDALAEAGDGVIPPGEDGAVPMGRSETGVAALPAQGDVPVVPGVEAVPGVDALPTHPQVMAEAGGGTGAPGEGVPVTPGGTSDPEIAGAVPGMAGSPAAGDALPETGAAPAPRSPGLGEPVAPIGDQAENVVTGRLPSIGDAAAADQPETLVPVEPAIRRNAAAFSGAGGAPLMSVLLIDAPETRSLLGDLKNLPFATSFVVDAEAPDAAETIAFYRDLGAEVVLSVPLPAGAAPADVEVVLQVYGQLLDHAVAMLVTNEAGFQTLGAAARQVALVLHATGHGLISMPQGLNTGHKSAVKEGVPAGLIFSELDNDGQSGAVIRRFMDNAAFRARQEEAGVIMLAHARQETIQALVEWSFGNRAQSVTLAPVSAVLLQGQQ